MVSVAPRIPTMYYLPKIHKDINCPPGCPIISGIDSITARIGKYIDYHLQPVVKKTPSYLKDTKDTIRLLDHIKWNGERDGLVEHTKIVYS